MNSINTPFSPEAIEIFQEAIFVMLKGMLGVFVFMLIFYLLVKFLEYIFKDKEVEV
ncbi:MAG: hypothetical protein PHY08_08940 [Candidatus Cloacimonetes bacterium]|jgi:Na+-transporting methylmalonyl-CoA/oxaloacetate decarboxylase gamma subunit|nr:hypothetical protein [Candidatus Cloacimonadota bacterium]MDD4156682.1 hypothetical protein [Candidatus Cloacimonadota bacterium]